ncbi:MAG: helix-hairpin-helix domain-containing protein, partial [Oscillospiraceae bacterium]|nr:helix-hairpin-helix domain-containing protein [Oscillospiraceae bacterium]
MERLRCIVERVTYVNEDNGYTVLRARVKGFHELVTVVGNLAAVNVGSVLTMLGEWTIDRRYGRQFSAAQWKESLPASILGIEKYLGSGMIKGVGPKFARRIVEKFGADTLAVIEEAPDRLIEVEGIGSKRVAMVKKAWADQKEVKNIMIFLQEHSVSTTHAFKIFKKYGNDSIATVKENPYRLADDIWGVGFKTADQIALKMGFDRESHYRCRSGIIYVLNDFSGDGHCFVQRETLIEKAAAMLEIDADKLLATVDQMLQEKDLICEPPDMIYLLSLFFSEKGAA